MPNKIQSHKIGRKNSTGVLTTLAVAKAHPKTHTIESMPNRGRGDTGRSKSGKK